MRLLVIFQRNRKKCFDLSNNFYNFKQVVFKTCRVTKKWLGVKLKNQVMGLLKVLKIKKPKKLQNSIGKKYKNVHLRNVKVQT